jgi:hypothetical protein
VWAAADSDASTGRLAGLLAAHQGLEDATLEESLGAEPRLADQGYRLSARPCVDGCKGCLPTGSDLLRSALAVAAVSRRLLEGLVEDL